MMATGQPLKMEYEVVIGVEVHAQLLTQSKLFCACPTNFGAEPNTNVCPVCLGLPGVLPALNKKAVEFIVRTGIALGCEISTTSVFARKNYYYPDLPKNYQISQYELPLCTNGSLDINVNGEAKKIRIRRIHLEEDAGKLLHLPGGISAVDFNRAGMPLMEIVTEADISSSDEAVEYLTRLKSILEYLEVSTANMEEGALRCEPNISVRKRGDEKLGTKAELKNLNSFKTVRKGIEYEVERHIHVLESGGKLVQETRRFDDETQATVTMRSKEDAHDYRYFPEPDLLPLVVSDAWKNGIAANIPELPPQKLKRYVEDFGLSDYDAAVLTQDKALAEFFEECVKKYEKPKVAANWVTNEYLKHLNERNISVTEGKVSPEMLVELVKEIDSGKVSGKIAKDVLSEMVETGKNALQIIDAKGLSQISDEGEIEKVVEEVLRENEPVANEYAAGKDKSLMFLVGQVMRKTKGKANPQLVNELLKARLRGS